MNDGVVTYLFTQGILGVLVIMLCGVVVKLYNKTERLEKEKSDILEARRLDYKEVTKELIEVVQSNSQNYAVLSEKIEVVKGGHR